MTAIRYVGQPEEFPRETYRRGIPVTGGARAIPPSTRSAGDHSLGQNRQPLSARSAVSTDSRWAGSVERSSKVS